MKLEKAVSCMWSCMLSFLLSFASVACLATAFEMAVDLKTIVLCCVITAGISSICYALPLGLVPLGGAALAAGYLWQNGELLSSIEALLYRLSRQYNKAYGWGIIRWSTNTADDMEPMLTLALCVLGVLIAITVAWTVSRRKTSIPGAVLSLLPLFACFVVTDTVPQLSWLYFFLLGLGMLLLTGTVRRQDEEQGNRLSAVVALPVALSLLIMFAVFPQDRYNGQENARHMVDTVINMEPIRSIVEHFTETGTTGTSIDGRSVNLKSVGIRLVSQAEILRVNTELQGTLYLRGRALDAYDGVSWTESGGSASVLNWPVSGDQQTGEVVISTRYAHRMLYLPYYVTSRDLQYVNVGLENEKKLSQYSFTCRQMPDAEVLTALYPTADTAIRSEWSWDLLQQFLHLSDSAKKWAVPLAREIAGDIKSPYHKAQAIAEYVRNSAAYDTNTRRMPSKEKDFAQWFLEDSDTGYCVHFATAATVLLQAAGIPARYVTGYVADVTDSNVVVVRAEDAHAWAEYWLPGYGWTVLEATPAAAEQTTGETEASTDAAQTGTDTTQPEETDSAAEGTKPTAGKPGTTQPHTQDLTVVWVILVILLLAAAVIGQRALRLYLHRRRRSRGSTNRQAIVRWQEVVQLSGLLSEKPDQALLELALMAKFSQHTLSEEQLRQFDDYILAARGRLKKRSVFHRFWYCFVLVVY